MPAMLRDATLTAASNSVALATAIRLHLGRSLDGALRDIAAQGEAVAEADKA